MVVVCGIIKQIWNNASNLDTDEARNLCHEKGEVTMEDKGFTIVYFPWEDIEGRTRVAGRFKTEEENDDFLQKIYEPESGWMEEELSTVSVIDNYNYILS